MPWIVGVICKRWREVAVTTTALWSDITVEHFEESGSAQRAAEMAQELLRRTGVSRPISFQIWSHHRASLSDFTRVILPAILPSSNRWHHLDLSLSPDEINCLSPMNGALSSLESLKIYPGERPGESICDLFKIAPRLSRLKIANKEKRNRQGILGGIATFTGRRAGYRVIVRLAIKIWFVSSFVLLSIVVAGIWKNNKI